MKFKLWQQVLVGMGLGIGWGCFLPELQPWVQPLATIYMNLVKMIVVPTVFFAILYGISHISDIRVIGRIGLRTFGVYGIITVTAVALGIAIASYCHPGQGVLLTFEQSAAAVAGAPVTLSELLVGIFPSNPIAAMANGNTLQVVFFAILMGLALVLAGESAAEARKVVASVTSAVFKLVELVIRTTPYGAFAIMAWVVGEHGFATVLSLSRLAGVILAGFALQYLIFGLMIAGVRLNPLKFYRKTSTAQSLAFATSSSKATIVPAIRELRERVGVSERVAGFVLPLGAAVNMAGSAIYISVCALFFAQVAGVELSHYQYWVLVITSTIGSIGAAGYPGGAVIMLGMVLPALGLPLDGIPLIMGIDRILDMFRTVINVSGDCTATVIVDRLGNTLNLEEYNR